MGTRGGGSGSSGSWEPEEVDGSGSWEPEEVDEGGQHQRRLHAAAMMPGSSSSCLHLFAAPPAASPPPTGSPLSSWFTPLRSFSSCLSL
eukprot:2059283-Lingulodinium_polyedra.AAC.1